MRENSVEGHQLETSARNAGILHSFGRPSDKFQGDGETGPKGLKIPTENLPPEAGHNHRVMLERKRAEFLIDAGQLEAAGKCIIN